MKTDNNDIAVSVFCIAFNQEKYIRQCLDSLLSQKTEFPYEILINDDVSTDGTREILSEYAERYPDRIRLQLQEENQYSKGQDLLSILLPLARGKYICFCEGDDFYLDDTKLQRQYEAMEAHPECSLCVHRVQSVSESGETMPNTTPNGAYPEGVKKSEDIIAKMTFSYSFHTSSYFLRVDAFRQLSTQLPAYYTNIMKADGLSDIPLFLYFAQKTSVLFLDRTMSAWRRNTAGGWSSRTSNEKRVRHYELINKMLGEYNEYTNRKYEATLLRAQKHNQYLIYSMTNDFKQMCRKEYRDFLNLDTPRRRAFARIASILPGFEKVYRQIKHRN